MTKMKWLRYLLAGALALQPLLVGAQAGREVRTADLTLSFDLDGAAASANAIVTVAVIVGNQSYTIAAQPDSPRPLRITVVDADSSITSCTATITGTAGNGTTITDTYILTGGSGVKAGGDLAFRTVTSVFVNVGCITPGGADTLTVGTTSTIPTVYPLASGAADTDAPPLSTDPFAITTSLDPYRWNDSETRQLNIPTSTTTSISASDAGAFTRLAAGDLILLNLNGGRMEERAVLTKTDNSNISVDRGFVGPSGPKRFSYRKLFLGTEANDGWVAMSNFVTGYWVIQVTTMAGTGGINATVQCRDLGGTHTVRTLFSQNFAVAGTADFSIDFRLAPWDQCRVGLAWGTNDDAEGGTLDSVSIRFKGTSRL